MKALRLRAATAGAALAAAVLAATLLASSCAGAPRVLDPAAVAAAPEIAAFAAEGGFPVQVREGRLPLAGGREIAYRVYEPALSAGSPALPPVLIGHGFRRSLANMEGWARLIASRGRPALVASFIRSSLLDGNHDLNAADLRALADFLAPEKPRIYAGFSAGGLSALVAAAADPLARAYLGLDPVDSGGLGTRAAAAWAARAAPSLFLFGSPSACNAENNLLAPVRGVAPPAWEILSIEGATHCHFENPWSEDCAGVCGEVLPEEASAALLERIRGLSLRFLEGLAALP